MSRRPAVLCLSGLDPTGGAGISADVESLAAFGVRALPLITALTAQTTSDVQACEAVDPRLLGLQLSALLDDCAVDAVKIGLLGSAAQVPVIAAALDRLQVPVVCDPVLRAGGGTPLADAALRAALLTQLLPRVTLLTPNAAEARTLAGADGLDACGAALLAHGATQVLITGGDEPEHEACNRWYVRGRAAVVFCRPRLADHFHGAGCTLASALAAQLALGAPIERALDIAQAFTHAALQNAEIVGRGRKLPRRFA